VRTDVYSLGIIMYEMLAGKVPFERATSVNILMAHVAEPPPPMREVNPNLLCSPAFEDIVMCCIAKDPNERFSSMDEVLQAIRRAHGSSMTGQIAALPYHVQSTGPFRVNQTGPPPPMPGWLPTPSPAFIQPAPMRPMYRSTPPPPGVTGSHTGMGMIRGEQAHDYSGFVDTKPRSKIWVLFGVLVAAGIGGGLGMLAFHWTAPKPVIATPAAPASSAAPAASLSAAPPASASAAPDKSTTIHITSDPPGATVKDGKDILCPSTPCDVTFKGEDAAKSHKLTLENKGFKSEPKTVKPSDAAKGVDVKLTKLPGAVAPAPGPKPAPTPSGFKDAYDK
jgi:serine/threonine-protein kinase